MRRIATVLFLAVLVLFLSVGWGPRAHLNLTKVALIHVEKSEPEAKPFVEAFKLHVTHVPEVYWMAPDLYEPGHAFDWNTPNWDGNIWIKTEQHYRALVEDLRAKRWNDVPLQIGFVVHLCQDLTSPTQNDRHYWGRIDDWFEAWVDVQTKVRKIAIIPGPITYVPFFQVQPYLRAQAKKAYANHEQFVGRMRQVLSSKKAKLLGLKFFHPSWNDFKDVFWTKDNKGRTCVPAFDIAAETAAQLILQAWNEAGRPTKFEHWNPHPKGGVSCW